MRSRIGEKDDNNKSSINDPYTQTNDVILNPRNPVNPDSKPQVKADEYYNETCRDG